MTPLFEDLLKHIAAITARPGTREERLQDVCRLLKREVAHYDWVGFYLVDPASPRELVLGPFDGAPTDHARIAFGQGICGQAAEREDTFVIQDVARETNYLSCSPHVKSEIVVPIFKDGAVEGEIDIDSHALAPFTPQDREFLEKTAQVLAELF
jgi:GAF domain-containing protein